MGLPHPRPTALHGYGTISHAFSKKVLFHHLVLHGHKALYAEDSFVSIQRLSTVRWTVLHRLSFVCVVSWDLLALHYGSQE